MSNATSKSRFGQVAIAEVIEDEGNLRLRIIDRDTDGELTKAQAIDRINEMLESGETEGRLALVRLNGFFQVQTKVVTTTEVFEVDEAGEPIPEPEPEPEPEESGEEAAAE